jgi:DNA-directed RNA polymerase specialized sigma24 family protein
MSVSPTAARRLRVHPQASDWVARQMSSFVDVPARTVTQRRHADACRRVVQHIGRTLGQQAARREQRGEDPAQVLRDLEAGLAAAEEHVSQDAQLVLAWPLAEPTIRAEARAFCRSPHDADELAAQSAADVFVAYRAGNAPTTATRGWLRTVTHNVGIDIYRASKRREEGLAEARREGRRIVDCSGDSTADSAIARDAIRALSERLAPHAGDTLVTARARASMRMRLAGMEDDEVAAQHGISRELVRQDFNRMRRMLEKEDPFAVGLLPPRNPRKGLRRATASRSEPATATGAGASIDVANQLSQSSEAVVPLLRRGGNRVTAIHLTERKTT